MTRLLAAGNAAALMLLPSLAMAGLAPPPGATPGPMLPEPLRSIVAWGFGLQRQMNGDLRQHLSAMKESGSWEPAAAIMLAAFLYGVFHAIGPGHGKVVIGSYFATRRARIGHGLAASLMSAMVQAGSAIVIVAALAGVLTLAPSQVMAQAGLLETASYGLITLVGVTMMVRTLSGKGCGHDHGHEHGHGGSHTECCGHDHDHHNHEHATPEQVDGRTLMGMATAVGFRPCSGAILVLLFTLANNMFVVGILATLAMGLGVAITLSAIGMGALGLNRLLERAFGGAGTGMRIRTGIAVAGAAAITLMGLVLLAGSLASGPALTG
jgi:ABC-type nickel/cobalt efflux system permease component RcnA